MATKKATKKSVSKSGEFAVISTGGKQYKVCAGDTLIIEKLAGKYNAGDEIVFEKVLLVDNGKDTTIGTPYISGAKVMASFIENGRHQKVIVMKYKPKSRYKKTNGHRQEFTKVKITAIK